MKGCRGINQTNPLLVAKDGIEITYKDRRVNYSDARRLFNAVSGALCGRSQWDDTLLRKLTLHDHGGHRLFGRPAEAFQNAAAFLMAPIMIALSKALFNRSSVIAGLSRGLVKLMVTDLEPRDEGDTTAVVMPM